MNTRKLQNKKTIKRKMKEKLQTGILYMLRNWLGGTYITCGRSITKSIAIFPSALLDNIRTGCSPGELLLLKKWIHNKDVRHTLFLKRDNLKFLTEMNNQNSIYLLREKNILLERMHEIKSINLGRTFHYVPTSGATATLQYLRKTPNFVIKPNDMAGGKGILIGQFNDDIINITRNNMKEEYSFEQLWGRIKNKDILFEEKICQNHYVNEVYAPSVNSIRIHTLQVNGNVEIVRLSTMRFGSGGGNVDFDGAIQIGINQDSGRLMDYGIQIVGPDCIKHWNHPDTGYAFADFQIPYWDETKKLVKEVALLVPEISFIGWDVAITELGPIIIEGNGNPLTYDIAQWYSLFQSGIGIKEEQNNILQLAREMRQGRLTR